MICWLLSSECISALLVSSKTSNMSSLKMVEEVRFHLQTVLFRMNVDIWNTVYVSTVPLVASYFGSDVVLGMNLRMSTEKCSAMTPSCSHMPLGDLLFGSAGNRMMSSY